VTYALDIAGLLGAVGTDVAGDLSCVPDKSMMRSPLAEVARAAGDVWRDSRERVGFVSSGSWVKVASCLPFQHVESRVPEEVFEGLLVPAHTTHSFRFHSSVDVLAGDVIRMRVGNYLGGFWLVDGAGARTTWQAQVLEVDVLRLLEAGAALEAVVA
jgi:hypothetical protein